MATATHSFIQQDGKIYFATGGVVASVVVTTANEIAKCNGAVTFTIEWQFAEARWRTRAIQDRDAFAIAGTMTVDEVQFRASTLKKLMSGVSTGTKMLYGTGTVTANYTQIRTSTAPLKGQFIFDFVRTDTNKRMQIYCVKAQCGNFPMPFAVGDFTKQNLTWTLMGSTSGRILEILVAK